ncbi:MAG: SURF1 family protein [Gammaproteobacteria bacterium]|nr:SURF1 family protein [Gammaproteobacteria bacterium]
MFIALGFWQCDRAKQATRRTMLYQENHKKIQELSTTKTLPSRDFLHVKARGFFDTKHTILLDNQIYQHRIGYYVFTPFIPENGPSILVNRGFLATDSKTRRHLPDIPAPPEEVQILTGTLITPHKPFLLKDIPLTESSPILIQGVELQKLEKRLGYPLDSTVLWLDHSSRPYQDDLIRDWHFKMNQNEHRHKAYALQWFLLAAVLSLLALKVVIQNR